MSSRRISFWVFPLESKTERDSHAHALMTLSCFPGRWQERLWPGMAPKQASTPTVTCHQVEQTCARTALPAAVKLPRREDTRRLPPFSFLPPLPSFPSFLMSLHSAPQHTPHATLLPWAHPLFLMETLSCFHACQNLILLQKQDVKNQSFHGPLSRTSELSH